MGDLKYIFVLILFLFLGCNQERKKTTSQNPKIWAHRTNSIEKLKRFSVEFNGLELDIVIQENGCLDVFHPPEPSKGLCLEEYLKQAKSINPDLKFWLDVKNLDSSNFALLLERLEFLESDLNFQKSQFYLESANWKILPELMKKGYFISYYIPSIDDYLKEDRNKVITDIKERIEVNSLNTISTAIDNHPYLVDNFPSKTKLLWATGKLNDEKLRLFELALEDSSVKVVLISP